MIRISTLIVFVLLTSISLQAQHGNDAIPLEESRLVAGSEFNLTLDITTDCWPEETSWKMVNAEGELVHEGGPYYGQELSEISEEFWLESGSYTFSFYDAAGDGLYATQWGSLCGNNGSFQLVDADGTILLADTGGMNFDTLVVSFQFNASVSIEEQEAFGELIFYPNPVSDVLNVSVELMWSSSLTYELIAKNGQVMRRESYGFLPASAQLISISMSNLPVGIYTLRIFSGQNAVSRRFVKVH